MWAIMPDLVSPKSFFILSNISKTLLSSVISIRLDVILFPFINIGNCVHVFNVYPIHI